MTLSQVLHQAGLTGRGGAAFSTARKLDLALANDARLLVNVCDGEIGAAKDAWVVQHHLVELVRGATLLAGSTNTNTVYAAHRDSDTARRLASAGLDVLEVPHRYVSSEETSLVNLLHGGLARPIAKRLPISAGGISPDEQTLEPTLVLNAETVWRTAQIVERGAQWFRLFGTASEPGPRLVSVSYAGQAPVVLETQAGEPVSSLLSRAGMPTQFAALNIGGLSGGFLLPHEVSELTWDADSLAPYSLSLGSGVIRVLPAQACPWIEIAATVRYAAGESAGQCGPCMFGLPAVADDVDLLVSGRGNRADLERLRHRLGILPGRGACHHPNGVARYIASALRCFGPELELHHRNQCSSRAAGVAGPTSRAARRAHRPIGSQSSTHHNRTQPLRTTA